MRFFKVFLVSFFSLIGSVSAVLGVMYVTGSFNKPVVNPASIYFKDASYNSTADAYEFNVDSDFTITISSPTEKVTETLVTLSLDNSIRKVENGTAYIADEKITIPEKVVLNQPFPVKLNTSTQNDMNIDWIVGGHTTIKADSESDIPIQTSVDINIDVPVYSISLKTMDRTTAQNVKTSFAKGETFLAEVEFVPEISKYKYGNDSDATNTKQVFFDISSNRGGIIQENATIINEMAQNKVSFKTGFDALEINDAVKVSAYVFQTSAFEDYYKELYATDEDAYVRQIKSAIYGKSSNETLKFENLSADAFAVEDTKTTTTNYLKFNQPTRVYAYDSSVLEENAVNLGISILNTTATSNPNGIALTDKVKDVGIRALYMHNGNLTPASEDQIKFIDCTARVLETAGGNITYYMPKVVPTNIDKTYWKVVSLVEETNFYFELYIFGTDDTENLAVKTISTSGNQVWKSSSVVATTLSWTSTADVNMTFIDNSDFSKTKSAEFDLADIIKIDNTEATFQDIKYLAYINDNSLDLSTAIKQASLTTSYTIPSLSGVNLFELSSSLLSVTRACNFNVLAVIIKTDYNNNEIQETDGVYSIYAYSTDLNTRTSFKPISINVNKTIQNISSQIYIQDLELLKNIQDTSGDISKISFVQNSGVVSIFDLQIILSANATTTIENEIDLFVSAYNAGNIKIDVMDKAGASDLLIIERPANIASGAFAIDGNLAYFSLPVYANSLNGGNDTELKVSISYATQSASYSVVKNVKSIKFGTDEARTLNLDFLPVEIYDGLVKSVEFGNEEFRQSETYTNSLATPLTKTTTLEEGELIEGDKYYANSTQVSYFDTEDNDLKEQILDGGKYILYMLDKYDNVISSNDYDLTTNANGNVSVSFESGEFSSSLTIAPTATLYITEQDAGVLTEVNKNAGKIEDNVWSSEFENITSAYLDNKNTIIQITRYAVNGSVIHLKDESGINGEKGLISALYAYNGKQYELSKILNYSLDNSISTYASCLTYDSENASITITKSIGVNIKLTLYADSGLGFAFQIQLSIVPNIQAIFELSNTTPQGDLRTSVNADNRFEIYSDNNVQFNITFKKYIKESFGIEYNSNFAHNTFKFDNDNTTYSITEGGNEAVDGTLTNLISLVVRYDYNELGNKEIKIRTNGGSNFDFLSTLKLVILPNIKLTNAVNGNVNKSVIIDGIGNKKLVLSGEDYSRIVADSINSTFNGVKLAIATTLINGVRTEEVYYENSTTPLANNTLFEVVDDTQIQAKLGAQILGKYYVKLNLIYNDSIVSGNVITLEILPNIQPIPSDNELFDEYFVEYNGTLCLGLKSNTSYERTFLKQNLFTNVNNFDFSKTSYTDVFELNIDDEIVVKEIFDYHYSPNMNFTLTLSNDFTRVSFPILFVPLDNNYVQYKNGSINDDLGSLNNTEQLARDNVYDSYDSGIDISLFRTNYVLTENEGQYTIKNQTPNAVYVVVHTGTGYYYLEVAPYKTKDLDLVDVSVKTFTLSDLSNFVKIINNESLTTNFGTTETKVIGVFSSTTNFTNNTKYAPERDYGLSQELLTLLQNSSYYELSIYEEENGDVSNTAYNLYTYNTATGVIKFNSIVEDKIVYIKISNLANELGYYRIKIVANSQLNLYYPYATGYANANLAEYLYCDNYYGVEVNLANALENKIPNSTAFDVVYRAILQTGNEINGFESTERDSYSLTYSLFSVTSLKDNITSYSEDYFTDRHFTVTSAGLFSIPHTTDALKFEIKITAKCGTQDMGTATYVIYVNDTTREQYSLGMADNLLTQYTGEEEPIAFGESYDFSNVVLVKSTNSGITADTDNLLNYHIYSNQNIVLDDYFNFNKTIKTLSIKEGLTLVKDIQVNFVYYTIYGEILNIPLTFSSNIKPEYNNAGNLTGVDINANSYSAYADTNIDLLSAFTLKAGDVEIKNGANSIRADYIQYKLDDYEFVNASQIKFKQITSESENHSITIKYLLSSFDATRFQDDYEFTISLSVLKSLISYHDSSDETKALKINSGKIRYTTEVEDYNAIYAEDLTSTDTIFNVVNEAILDDYNLTYSIKQGESFIDLDNSSFNDIGSNKIKLAFIKCPANETTIIIEFKLKHKTNDFTIYSYIKFTLTPDVVAVKHYPSPDGSIMDKEAKYLSPNKINGTGQDNSFNINSDASEAICLNTAGYFGENRITFAEYDNQDNVVNLSALGDRVKVQVSVEKNYLITYYKDAENREFFGDNILANFADNIMIQWKSAGDIQGSVSDSVTFKILIDGIERETFTIEFYSMMSNIFSVEINYLYDSERPDEYAEVDAEILFVEQEQTEKLLSHQTALLNFRSQVITEKMSLDVYNSTVNTNNLLGSFVLNAGQTNYSWLLIGQAEINLSNLIFVKPNADPTKVITYPMIKNVENSAYSNILLEDTANLTYRLKLKYLDEYNVDYSKIKDNVIVGDATNIEAFSFSKASDKIGTIQNIPIKISNEIIGEYNYLLVYDFKVENTYKSSDLISITAGVSEVSNAFDSSAFGISGLKYDYDDDYFVRNNVSFDFNVIMITTTNFLSNPSPSNVRYYYSGLESYCNEVQSGCLALATQTSTNFVTFTQLGTAPNVKIAGNGAELGGNIAYILVKYMATGTSYFTYEIIKIQVLPSIQENTSLINDINNSSSQDNDNNKSRPLSIDYEEGTTNIENLILAKTGTETSYINIATSLNSNNNIAVSSTDLQDFTYTMQGDLVGYLKVVETQGVNLILKKDTKNALYGDKNGYILITDKYGYTLRYYITLHASNDNALAFAESGEIIVNNIANDHIVYENTEVLIMDANQGNSDLNSDQAGFRIQNLKKIADNGFTYKVDYSIEELNFAPEHSLNNHCFLPTLPTNTNEVVDFNIIITIYDGDDIVEVVTLTKEIEIEKRYQVRSETGSVREGIAFNLTEYVYVVDKKENISLGTVQIINNTKTLIADASLADTRVNLTAIPTSGSSVSQSIVIGKDANGVLMTATNGKFYHKLQTYEHFVDLELKDYVIEGYDPSTIEVLDDVLVSLVTVNQNNANIVSVNVNNGAYKFPVPFALNFNGKQIKSVREQIIASDLTSTQKTEHLSGITDYELDAEAISAVDMQKIKNFAVYNDTITLKVMPGVENYTVRVYTDATHYKYLTFIADYDYVRYDNISISQILNSQIIAVNTKIEIIFSFGVGDFSQKEIYKNHVAFADYTPNNIQLNYDSITTYCTYTVTLNEFSSSILTTDEISVLDSEEFTSTNNNLATIKKYYLVKYSQDNKIVSVPVEYNVSPKFYKLDNFGLEQTNTNVIYLNQYNVSTDVSNIKIFEIDFDVWACEFNLMDQLNNIIARLNTCKDDLKFVISSNSARFDNDSNYNIITNTNFTPQQFIDIEVWVKVNDNVDELVKIGSVRLQISTTDIYVDVVGTYTINITSTEINNLTMNATHTFAKNNESIYDIITLDENFSTHLNEDKQIGLMSGSTTTYVDIADCSVAVVTVVDGIYSSVYTLDEHDGGNLLIKLKLNEDPSIIGKSIQLSVLATKTKNNSITQNPIGNEYVEIIVGNNGHYNLTYYEESTDSQRTFYKDLDGYYNVAIPFKDIFANTFVPTDYFYSVKVAAISEANLDIIYFNNPITANEGDTLFFSIAYLDGENSSTVIVGVKNDENVQSTTGGYPIDISDLAELNSINNFTVRFLGAYNLACEDNGAYYLLVKVKNSRFDTTYSLARINDYSNDKAFEVIDYTLKSSAMISISLEGSSVEIYNSANILSGTGAGSAYYLPSVVNIHSSANANEVYYFGVYGDSRFNSSVYGISTSTANTLNFDFTTFADFRSITVRNLSSAGNMVGNITGLFGGGNIATTYWQGIINSTTTQFVDSQIIKSTKTIGGVNETYYSFSDAPMLYNSNYVNATLITTINSTIDLSSYVPETIINDKTYNFELRIMLGENVENRYIALNGSQLTSFNILSVLSNISLANNDGVVIAYQNLTNSVEGAGLVKYQVYDSMNNFKAITASNYVVCGNYYISSNNPLDLGSTTGAYAIQITGNLYSLAIPSNFYYLTIDNSGTKSYVVFYRESASTYQYDLSTMVAGNVIQFTTSNEYIASLKNTDTITFYVDEMPYNQFFRMRDANSHYQSITVYAGYTSTVIDVNDSRFPIDIINLYIMIDNT